MRNERLAIVAVTERGKKTALKIKDSLRGAKLYIPEKLSKGNDNKKGVIARSGATRQSHLFKGGLKDFTRELFKEYNGIIFCMATGIVVRAIAPYVKSKYTDPAVVVVDDEARFAVSLLSGHEGGANNLAIQIANILNAEPVVTTASEVVKKLVIGIGCRRGIKKEEIACAVKNALTLTKSTIDNVRCLATIDLKQDEKGLIEASTELGIPLRIISADVIRNFNGQYQRSSFVKEKVGVDGVCEPCALLAARMPKLILPKQKMGNVTIAVTKECRGSK